MTWAETVPDGLPFEQLATGEPTATLNGGSHGLTPILAERTQEAITGLRSATDDVAGALSDLEGRFESQGMRVIERISAGGGTNTTEFADIPQNFESLMLWWWGHHDGGDTDVSLGIRFNGDGGSNYASQRILSRSDTLTVGTGTFSILRVGIVGRFTGSAGSVYIPHYSTSGVTKSAMGDSYGRDLVGDEYRGWGHGRWVGTTSAVTAIRIWPSGQLWGSTPHLLLVGIPGGG